MNRRPLTDRLAGAVAGPVRCGMACASLVLLATAPLGAQQHRVEQLYTADGIRLDFPPDGVWRVKARLVAQERARLLSLGRYSALNGPMSQAARNPANNNALEGVLYVPTILIAFKNTDTTSLPKAAQYDSIYYTSIPKSGRPYTVRTFYEEVSHGLFSVQGKTFGWVAVDSPSTYYLGGCPPAQGPIDCATGRSRTREMMTQAIQRLDGVIDFRVYDNNGTDGNPNSGDDDGFVDLVQFVQPIRGAECSGPGYNAHKFSLSGLGGPYATADGVTANSYIIVSGIGGTNCTTDTEVQGIGTTSHELGHGIGLPDLYDIDPTDADTSEGIGEFGLMGSGNYASLISPAHYEAWSLQQMGWVALRQLSASGTYSVGAVESSDTVFVIKPLGANPRGEYYLLENKQAVGSDTANMLHGPRPKGGGLLIWHVDSTKTAQTSASNAVNTGATHGLALIQADGLNHLAHKSGAGGNRGDAGDPYPGTSLNMRLSYNTTPANVKNSDGTFAGFEIDSVKQVIVGGTMSFKLTLGGLTIVRAADTLAQVSVDAVKYRRFAQLLSPASVHPIAIDSAQFTADSLRQFVFQSWSDLGARQHDITAQVAGDSISANVQTRFRVRVTASGTGTVTSNPNGDLAAGIYVRKDSTISLKAVPTGGKIWGGWSGDTTSNADSILVTATRSFTLVAGFHDPLVAVAGAPPAPVMGKWFSHNLGATGGSGAYAWQITSGALPDGLTLGGAGAITGIPSKVGSFSANAKVTSGTQTDSVSIGLTVTAPTLVTADVVSQILGTRAPLSADELKYLDLLGNNNSQFDVGDFLAWVQDTGAAAPPLTPAIADPASATSARRTPPPESVKQ